MYTLQKHRRDYRYTSGKGWNDFLDVHVAAAIARESNCRMEILSRIAQNTAGGSRESDSGLPAVSQKIGGPREIMATFARRIWPIDSIVHKIIDH